MPKAKTKIQKLFPPIIMSILTPQHSKINMEQKT